MSQVKIFGHRDHMRSVRQQLSDTVHSCLVDALELPQNKRFHRFFPMDNEDFIYPEDRTERYTIIEISMFEGRSIEAKKKLIRLLFERIQEVAGITTNDLEITIFETPKHNWGIRGLPGNELELSYNTRV